MAVVRSSKVKTCCVIAGRRGSSSSLFDEEDEEEELCAICGGGVTCADADAWPARASGIQPEISRNYHSGWDCENQALMNMRNETEAEDGRQHPVTCRCFAATSLRFGENRLFNACKPMRLSNLLIIN